MELLLLGQPLKQLFLPGTCLLLPAQLLLLEDLFSEALLFFYLQTIQPRLFVFIGKLWFCFCFLFGLNHRADWLDFGFSLALCAPGPTSWPRGR